MTDQVLLTADRHNIEDSLALAIRHNLGLEIMTFAYPDVLDGNWKQEVANYRSVLRALNGPLTLHGPFMDMVSGSPDARINQVCMQRYHQTMNIANDLGSAVVVFHANFIGSLHNLGYREGWHARSVPFWWSMAEYAQRQGVTIAMENMWEFEPGIIADILREVNHPNLRACLDVGHASLFSDDGWTLQDWIDTLAPWLIHTHVNNNDGKIDEHHGFDWPAGVLDYHDILNRLRALQHPPNIVLEMWQVEDMRESLYYLDLEPAARRRIVGE